MSKALVSRARTTVLVATLCVLGAGVAHAQQPRPNILVIWGDDIGVHNVSAYTHAIMGYRTPNIDRIAREGAIFTDAYAQQSCTAGRASFILGQHPFRTGLLTIGMPGSPQGIPDWAPTIADLLKPLGYATGQFGKNHLGDRDSHLPTMHGFDEFLGNLYHLNAEEEPETYYYPKDPEFRKKFGPRGVLHTWADGKGGQKIDDTGPLTRQRMETVDGEIFAAAEKFIDKSVADKKPFFVWFNTTRMHVWTHLRKSAQGRTGIGLYPDGMVEHDDMVGALLKKLDDLGIASNTIVVYSTDNGAETVTWPDGGTTPRFGARRARRGRAVSECRSRSAGQGPSSPGPSTTTSSPRRTGCLPCSPRRGRAASRTSSSRAIRPAGRHGGSTSTGTTSCPTSRAR